jgi:LmbE family N-acetylglucosaminyl deacetylase
MSVAFPSPGTDERLWREWPGLAALPSWDPEPGGRVLVVVPHPDDDVLALGGTLQRLAARGSEISLVAVTDGDAAWDGMSADERSSLASIRREEAVAALSELQLSEAGTVRLGLADRRVADEEGRLTEVLRDRLAGVMRCYAPWSGDGHIDHEAAGRAAAKACAAVGVPLSSYPVWMWHWAKPGDASFPWHQAVRVTLDEDQCARKARAVASYASQISDFRGRRPVLPADFLAHFGRDFEVLVHDDPQAQGLPS